MAHKKYASAYSVNKSVQLEEWMDVIREQNDDLIPKDKIHRMAKNVLRKADPNQFLLSHATIVASVDTFAPKNSKTGRLINRGVQIDVRFPDFRIVPECSDLVNNNGDAWSRSLLLSTYRTFIGAHNYLEHVQVPELSKGFIADAVARDLGRSCYIDILVATNRKHAQLVADINSGELNSLSMGCFLPGTLVTMWDGSVLPIEQIRPDMNVISQKGNVCRVENLQVRENRWDIISIKSSGLSVINATDTHKFYAVSKNDMEYGKKRYVKKGKTLSALIQKSYELKHKKAGDIEVGDVIATPIPIGLTNPTVSLEEARLLGVWVGEGWKFNNKHDITVGAGFCIDASDVELTEFVQSSLDRISWVHGEGKRVVNGEQIFKTSCTSTRRNANYILSTSPAFRDMVDSLVDGRGALTKVISDEIMTWPEEHQLAFMSGVVDSDGCVSKSKAGTTKVFISTRNRNLANQYQIILARCGIVSVLSKASRKGTKLLPNSAGIDYQIAIRNDQSKKIPSLKINRVRDAIKYTPGNSDRWISGGYLYSRVKKISTSSYTGFVYDLEVDHDHSYIANGYGVSNCISAFTTCTKCGNVAADDSQLCPCIQYEGKRNTFIDEEGIEHLIGELIGHVSVPNSNQFIEASWVHNPAFAGAVRRNILNPDTPQIAAKLQDSGFIYEIRREIPELDGLKRAASVKVAQQGEEPQAEPEEAPPEAPETDDAPTDPPSDSGDSDETQSGQDSGGDEEDKGPSLDKEMKELQNVFMQNMMEKLKESLAPKAEDVGVTAPLDISSTNDNLIHASLTKKLDRLFPGQPRLVRWAAGTYMNIRSNGIAAAKKAGMTPKETIVLSWIIDQVNGLSMSPEIYKAAISSGPSNRYPSEISYLASCQMKIGRPLTKTEQRTIINAGRIASAVNP
jgi:intein/homing endonuclease